MSGNSTYEPGKRQFGRGMLLAWAPILALIIAITFIFRGGISEHKATGLGAVAGGLAEGYLVFGLVLRL
ncbi:MAG TPA: hypothetical protein VLC12_04750 [Terriglobales bacterium]|nr:hypothetical protein [Terriglobales bacterium]